MSIKAKLERALSKTATQKRETLSEHIARLRKDMNNRSSKRLQRLRASIAFFEHKHLIDNLPGSARRGLQRGHL